jgi:hypothetical protein
VDHKVRDHSLIVRRARPHDALRIARVHVQSWQSTYRGVLPPDYLDSLTRPGAYSFGSASFVRPIGPDQA